jgi:legumain
MENSDRVNLQNETLNRQYEIVREKTTDSHIKHYGDITLIGNEFVSKFQGAKRTKPVFAGNDVSST